MITEFKLITIVSGLHNVNAR